MTRNEVKRAKAPKRGDTFKLHGCEVTVVSFDGFMVECVMNMTWGTSRRQWNIEKWREAVKVTNRMNFEMVQFAPKD